MNRIQQLSAAILAATLLNGCAHKKPPAPKLDGLVAYSRVFAERSDVVSLPVLGTTAEVEVGQSMVSTARRYTTPGIRLSAEIVHEQGQQRAITLPAGTYALAGENTEGKFYRWDRGLKLMSWGKSTQVVGGIFVPADSAMHAKIYWFPPLGAQRPVAEQHSDEIVITPAIAERWDGESFRRELVYTGVSQNTISILYREFKDDMARPAFSQELKYDLSQGRSIGYNGARFEIDNATNISITYRVIRPLN